MDKLAFPAFAEHGLTRRELFAAMAMQGLLHDTPHYDMSYQQAATHAVAYADALIAELEKPKP